MSRHGVRFRVFFVPEEDAEDSNWILAHLAKKTHRGGLPKWYRQGEGFRQPEGNYAVLIPMTHKAQSII